MQKSSLLSLYFIFVKIGAILLGGGYVILPIITNEFVEKRNLIDNDELISYFALSQSLPGIIAANISMFVGYKIRGVLGALSAMLGIVTVPIISILTLASLLGLLFKNVYFQAVMWGVGIAVMALIMLTIREIWQKSKCDLFFYIIFVLSLSGLLYFKLTPIQTILIFTLVGILYKHFATPREAK